jgi:hypothetical protein
MHALAGEASRTRGDSMSRERETVLRRPVQVECIPDGTPLELPEGTWGGDAGLGSNFAGGRRQLVRLKAATPTPSGARFQSGRWCPRW